MDKKNYGIFMILVSVVVVVIYTFWVPVSYVLNNGKEPVILSNILPAPIWGLIIPVYLLILLTAFVFSWIGWNIMHSPPQEEISLNEVEKNR